MSVDSCRAETARDTRAPRPRPPREPETRRSERRGAPNSWPSSYGLTPVLSAQVTLNNHFPFYDTMRSITRSDLPARSAVRLSAQPPQVEFLAWCAGRLAPNIKDKKNIGNMNREALYKLRNNMNSRRRSNRNYKNNKFVNNTNTAISILSGLPSSVRLCCLAVGL